MQFSEIPEACVLAFSCDGNLFAFGGNDYRVHVHKTKACLETLLKNRTELRAPVFEFTFCSPIARIAFGEGYSTCRRLTSRIPTRKLRDKTAKVVIMAVGLQNGSIRVVDMDKGEVILVLEDHKRSISCLSFNSNGSLILASTSLDGTCKFWDLWDDGNMYRTLRDSQLDGKACYSCAWAPDSNSICVTAGPQNAALWDVSTFKLEGRLSGHKHLVTSCDFSPDNTLVVTASMDTSVIVWERRTCRPLRQLWHMGYRPLLMYLGGANTHHVTKVRFSRDSVHLISVCIDKKVRLWDLDNGSSAEPEMVFTAAGANSNEMPVADASLSPSGDVLVMSCVDQRESFFTVAETPVRRDLLMHFCRSTVRQALSHSEITNLQLPEIMKRYLCFEHNIQS